MLRPIFLKNAVRDLKPNQEREELLGRMDKYADVLTHICRFHQAEDAREFTPCYRQPDCPLAEVSSCNEATDALWKEAFRNSTPEQLENHRRCILSFIDLKEWERDQIPLTALDLVD